MVAFVSRKMVDISMVMGPMHQMRVTLCLG